MKLKATVELEISAEERKRIALEYLESLIPYNHVLFKVEDNHYWYECFKNHEQQRRPPPKKGNDDC